LAGRMGSDLFASPRLCEALAAGSGYSL
jgi:hypothetical protein